MIPTGWTKVDKRHIAHDSGRATVELVPFEPRRWGRHFIVRVDDDWLYQGGFGTAGAIRMFYSLTDAVTAAESKMRSNDEAK